jgi:2-aminoethylphosphonate-pyruvate transaminase
VTAAVEATATGPIELWLEPDEPDPFVIFDAMRASGVSDVRRVGVVCTTPAHVEAARAAGAGAVVGVSDSGDLTAAAPDVVSSRDELDAVVASRWGPQGSQRRLVLLNPGPALTSDAVKRAAAGVDICHREQEYVDLDRRIRSKLRRLAGVDEQWRIGILSGTGTAANEAALRSAVRPGRLLIVVVNGVYGERLRESARRAGIETVSVEGSWTEPIDPAQVAAALAIESRADALAVVHHETTTGLLNPLAELSAFAAGSGVLTLVDAISSFGVEELDVADGIDFLTCTSNKCLHGLPGASFVVVSPAGSRRLHDVEPTSVALDLGGYLETDTTAVPPFTPAIPALASLDVALDRALVEGIDGRRKRYAARCAFIDEALDRLGLEQIVAPGARSHSIRSVRLPDGLSFAALHDNLRAAGFVVYAGQGALAREIFRIACMGELELADLERFVVALERALAVLRA